jgi:hypothetical protein
METAQMGNSEFDDVAAHLLEPEESLDSEQTGIDLDEGYSPPESPRELGDWGLTAREARTHESLAHRLAREVPDVTDRWDGDGIGDSADSDGEPIDDQVGDSRAGRLVAFGIDPADPTTDYRAHDVGIDGGAASAEEAAMHIIAEDDTIAGQRWRLLQLAISPTPWCRSPKRRARIHAALVMVALPVALRRLQPWKLFSRTAIDERCCRVHRPSGLDSSPVASTEPAALFGS